MQQTRGSYLQKNDTEKQIIILNNILPLFGIKNINDTTSISSKETFSLEKINNLKKDLQEHFRTSGIKFPIENSSQALALLKKLCTQAYIPFDWRKATDRYTFNLVIIDQNLRILRSAIINTENEDKKIPLHILENEGKISENKFYDVYTKSFEKYGILKEDMSLYDRPVNSSFHFYFSEKMGITYKIGNNYCRIINKIPRSFDLIRTIENLDSREYDILAGVQQILQWKTGKTQLLIPNGGIIFSSLLVVIKLSENEIKEEIPSLFKLYCTNYFEDDSKLLLTNFNTYELEPHNTLQKINLISHKGCTDICYFFAGKYVKFSKPVTIISNGIRKTEKVSELVATDYYSHNCIEEENVELTYLV